MIDLQLVRSIAWVKLSTDIKEVDYAEMRTRLYLNLGRYASIKVWNVIYLESNQIQLLSVNLAEYLVVSR